MSFFSSQQRLVVAHQTEPTDDQPEPEPPEWFGPRRGTLPGQATERAIIFRTDRAVLVAKQFEVYPTGLEFTLDLRLRDSSDECFETPWELHGYGHRRRRGTPEVSDDLLRLGIEFSDGRAWSNVAPTNADWNEPPESPVLMGRGGGGGGDQWEMRYWLWPLPPPERLTFHAAWPLFDIDETSVSVDATALLEASKQSELLWQ